MSAISSLLQSRSQSKAASKAAQAQIDAAQIASDTTMQMFNISRADTAGQRALFQYAAPHLRRWAISPASGFNLSEDPLYNIQKEEIMGTINERSAAEGKFSSSSADDAITRNLAALTTDAYNRFMKKDDTRYSRMLDLAKIGSGAAQSAGQNALSAGSTIGGYQLAAGDAIAQSALQSGAAQANMWQNIGQTNTAIGSALLQRWLTKGAG